MTELTDPEYLREMAETNKTVVETARELVPGFPEYLDRYDRLRKIADNIDYIDMQLSRKDTEDTEWFKQIIEQKDLEIRDIRYQYDYIVKHITDIVAHSLKPVTIVLNKDEVKTTT